MSGPAREIITSGDIDPRTPAHLSLKWLEVATPNLLIFSFGESEKIPRNSTTTWKARRYLALPTDEKKLVEGVTPVGSKLDYEDVELKIDQYGDWVPITDVVHDTHTDPVLQKATKALGQASGEMLQRIGISILCAGTSVFYANGTSRSAVNTVPSKNLVRKVVKSLKRNRAMPVTEMLRSTPSYGTEPVKASYIACYHPDLTPDLEDCAGWVPAEKYGQISPFPFETGSIGNLRFIEQDTMLPYLGAGGTPGTGIAATDGKADVYPILVFAKEAFATIALKGYSDKVADSKGKPVNPVKMLIVPVGEPSKSDPLAQRGSVAYKTQWGCGITQDLNMCRMEVACTD